MNEPSRAQVSVRQGNKAPKVVAPYENGQRTGNREVEARKTLQPNPETTEEKRTVLLFSLSTNVSWNDRGKISVAEDKSQEN